MDVWYFIKSAILGIVEGVTEFLPISSTAHLLIVGKWLSFDLDSFQLYAIVIQLGAILAVIVLYRQRITELIVGFFTGRPSDRKLALNLILAFLPAACIGLLLNRYISQLLEGNFFVYASTLFLGGLVMLWVERHPVMSKAAQKDNEVAGKDLDKITWKQALVVGFAQCLAMIPGTSRSGSTIVAGMMAGIPRKVATEFSFFLAIPTMIGASTLSLIKQGAQLEVADHLYAVIIGFVLAFVSALFVIRVLMRFLSQHSYRPFAWYRIALGLFVAVWAYWIL
ncbi:undecaprenyl-diphosphate phosphatase [Basilea psittacipulmonis]|nr:undecaprenyl-diphosphate phosphatase [Basilea psittacipulmonis]